LSPIQTINLNKNTFENEYPFLYKDEYFLLSIYYPGPGGDILDTKLT